MVEYRNSFIMNAFKRQNIIRYPIHVFKSITIVEESGVLKYKK